MLNKEQEKIFFQTPEYKKYKQNRVVGYLILFIIIITIIIDVFYIKNNVYKLLDKTNHLLIIKSNPLSQPINFKLHEQVINNLQTKQNLELITSIRNPLEFKQQNISSTSTTSSLKLKN